MAKVPNAVEILPNIWTAWVGSTNVTDDRQTDGRATANSEREREFTFAKNGRNWTRLFVSVWNLISGVCRRQCNGRRAIDSLVADVVAGSTIIRFMTKTDGSSGSGARRRPTDVTPRRCLRAAAAESVGCSGDGGWWWRRWLCWCNHCFPFASHACEPLLRSTPAHSTNTTDFVRVAV